MTVFALAPVEGGKEIALADAKVTVGRGPFLRVVDKRVSRHHAIIEVSGSTITVQPIHTNPTFYKAHDATEFKPLEKDHPKELHHGDLIAFLPNDLIFEVRRNDQSNSVVSDEVEMNSESKEEIKIVNNLVKDENDLPMGLKKKKNEEEKEEEKEFEVVQPLKKTRKLPSWMTNNKEKTPSKTPKKLSTETKSKRILKKAQENSATVTTEEEMEEKRGKEGPNNLVAAKDQIETDSCAEEEETKLLSTVAEEEPKKRKRDLSDEHDQVSSPEKTLPICPYGTQCYRKNPVHFQEYSHDKSAVKSDDENGDDLPECPYGTSCYRRNRQHQKEYSHSDSKVPKLRERKAKKAKKVAEDDSDLPNDYDFDDSFIDDESDSSCELSENEDTCSDWQPDDDQESGDEDVGQLLLEAKQFAKNKKLLKPS